MAKKREIVLTDDSTLDTPEFVPETLKSTSTLVSTPALHTLLESGIIDIVDGAIIWREGHLAHIRSQYSSDPTTCERNYADELAVMRENGIEL
jgi:hypothetical protein